MWEMAAQGSYVSFLKGAFFEAFWRFREIVAILNNGSVPGGVSGNFRVESVI